MSETQNQDAKIQELIQQQDNLNRRILSLTEESKRLNESIRQIISSQQAIGAANPDNRSTSHTTPPNTSVIRGNSSRRNMVNKETQANGMSQSTQQTNTVSHRLQQNRSQPSPAQSSAVPPSGSYNRTTNLSNPQEIQNRDIPELSSSPMNNSSNEASHRLEQQNMNNLYNRIRNNGYSADLAAEAGGFWKWLFIKVGIITENNDQGISNESEARKHYSELPQSNPQRATVNKAIADTKIQTGKSLEELENEVAVESSISRIFSGEEDVDLKEEVKKLKNILNPTDFINYQNALAVTNSQGGGKKEFYENLEYLRNTKKSKRIGGTVEKAVKEYNNLKEKKAVLGTNKEDIFASLKKKYIDNKIIMKGTKAARLGVGSRIAYLAEAMVKDYYSKNGYYPNEKEQSGILIRAKNIVVKECEENKKRNNCWETRNNLTAAKYFGKEFKKGNATLITVSESIFALNEMYGKEGGLDKNILKIYKENENDNSQNNDVNYNLYNYTNTFNNGMEIREQVEKLSICEDKLSKTRARMKNWYRGHGGVDEETEDVLKTLNVQAICDRNAAFYAQANAQLNSAIRNNTSRGLGGKY